MYYGDRIRVLVADDEPAVCNLLKRGLVQAGYEVVVVHTCEDAQKRYNTEHFDAFIADLRMTDDRGDVMYYNAIGAQPHLQHATLFLTGDVTDAGRRLIEATACPVFGKPFDVFEIIGMVNGFCRRARPASA